MSAATHSAASHQAVERVARDAYGRLLSWLAYQWRDVAAAEDALSQALVKALELWPVQGVPDAPQAWLLQVARRECLQVARRERLHQSPEVQALLEDEPMQPDAEAIPDNRLRLMFVCAHPAIDVRLRPALMLQTVLGLDAKVIAQAMLTSPAAMAQRLVRAKLKIRDAGLRFETPEGDELPARLGAVLEALYAAYGLGWDAQDMGAAEAGELRQEALFLSELVCRLMPEAAEGLGLQALMRYCEARSGARFDDAGRFVPLPKQDAARWDREAILLADRMLEAAAGMGRPGPFQIEAAIQSAHCQRLHDGTTPWAAIAWLHEQLELHAPSLGARVAHAVAVAECGEVQRALAMLADMDPKPMASYQPYWVARSHLEALNGDVTAARQSLAQAIGLTTSPAVRAYLTGLQGGWAS